MTFPAAARGTETTLAWIAIGPPVPSSSAGHCHPVKPRPAREGLIDVDFRASPFVARSECAERAAVRGRAQTRFRRHPMGDTTVTLETVVSKDGTTIGFSRQGEGP